MSNPRIQAEIKQLLTQEKTLRERRQTLERRERTNYQKKYLRETAA